MEFLQEVPQLNWLLKIINQFSHDADSTKFLIIYYYTLHFCFLGPIKNYLAKNTKLFILLVNFCILVLPELTIDQTYYFRNVQKSLEKRLIRTCCNSINILT